MQAATATPGAAAADDDAAIDLTVANGGGDGLGDVGIIDRRAGMRAQVEDFVALLGQDSRQVAFHLKPGMVGADGNSHGGHRIVGCLGCLGCQECT